jgi:hypothetical protein
MINNKIDNLSTSMTTIMRAHNAMAIASADVLQKSLKNAEIVDSMISVKGGQIYLKP